MIASSAIAIIASSSRFLCLIFNSFRSRNKSEKGTLHPRRSSLRHEKPELSAVFLSSPDQPCGASPRPVVPVVLLAVLSVWLFEFLLRQSVGLTGFLFIAFC